MTDRCTWWIRDGFLPNLMKKTDGAFHLIAKPMKSLSSSAVQEFAHFCVLLRSHEAQTTHYKTHFDFTASAHGAAWLMMGDCLSEICSSHKIYPFTCSVFREHKIWCEGKNTQTEGKMSFSVCETYLEHQKRKKEKEIKKDREVQYKQIGLRLVSENM